MGGEGDLEKREKGSWRRELEINRIIRKLKDDKVIGMDGAPSEVWKI